MGLSGSLTMAASGPPGRGRPPRRGLLRGSAQPYRALGEERLELAGRGGQPPGKVLFESLEPAPGDHRLMRGVALGRTGMGLGFENRPLNGGSTFWASAISVHDSDTKASPRVAV